MGQALARVHVRHVTGVEDVAHTRCLTCHGEGTPIEYVSGTAHPTPFDVIVDADGEALYIACGPTRRVAVVGVAERALSRWIEIDGNPGGIALSPDGATLAVSLDDARAVALIDPESGRELARLDVGLEPAGLAFANGGETLFVANSGSGDVSVVDVGERRERLRVPAGREPFRVVVSPVGGQVAVASRMASLMRAHEIPYAELTLLDEVSGRVARRVRLTSTHQAEGMAYSADGTRILVPSLRVRNLLPITQVARGWVVSGVLCSVDAATGELAVLPLGTVNRPFADPAGIAVSTDGSRAWIASGGGDTLASIDLAEALEHEEACAPELPEPQAITREYLDTRVPTGARPGGVATIGDLVVVTERLSDTVAFYRADDLALVARVPLGRVPDDDEVQRGARVFHDASFAFQGAFSCRSCHPGGHTDGLTYDFDIDGVGRNVVLNRSLHGVKGTAPFKWVGLNPTLKRQCGARFAMVLTRADVLPEERLDDLVAYIESMPPPRPTGGAEDMLGFRNGAAERGRALFFRSEKKDGTPIAPQGRCVTCHSPPHYSNLGKADVGTATPYDKTGEFDVPHLTGIGRKAPYMHDGRAISLEEIWTAPGVENHHGVVTDLNKADLNDLVEFLRGL
jgi:YVTN family beta-propeller protein